MMSSQRRCRHGSLLLLLPQMLLLLLLINVEVSAQDDKDSPQRRQDFTSNFGGPPLGEHGFVGANPLPRPQGVVDLGSFGDSLAPSDVFQQVDQTFNIGSQLTHVTANIALTSESTTPSPVISTASIPSSSSSPSRVPSGHRRQRAPFHPRLPLQQQNSDQRRPPRPSNSIRTKLPKRIFSSFSTIVIENSTNIPLEPGTFQPNLQRTELSNDISSFSPSKDLNENQFVAADGVLENTAFKVFHGTETEPLVDAGSDNFSTPEDVLTVNFEQNQETFPHQGVRGNRHPGHLGRPNRRPSRPSRRPLHQQQFNGRPRNKPRRDQRPSLLSLLAG